MTAWEAWTRYRTHYAGAGRSLLGIAALVVAGALLVLPIPIVIQQALDAAIPEGRRGYLLVLGIGLVLLQAASTVVIVIRKRVATRHTKAATRRLRQQLSEKLYDVSIDYHRRSEVSTLHDWVVQETSRVDAMADVALSVFAPSLAVAIGLSAVLIYLNWVLYLITISVVPLMVLTHRLVMPRLREAIRANRLGFRSFADKILFVLRTMDLTRRRAAEERELDELDVRLRHLEQVDWESSNLSTIYGSMQQTVVATAAALILVVGGISAINGALTVGELFAFYAGLALLRSPLTFTLTSIPDLTAGLQSLTQVYEFLEDPDRRPYDGASVIDFTGRVSLQGISFDYGQAPLIREANLELSPGRVSALVGRNGSGKSTVVSLILGTYRPKAGTVVADGVPYDDLDLKALRRHMGVVPQEPTIISGSVFENIAYGIAEPRMDDVVRAARLSAAHDFISALPHGYETEITFDGLTLSGGQRQRIAIARALVANPRLLILDEPTNHIDAELFEALLDRLVSVEGSPAVLLISHHPSIDRWADDLYRIQDGFLTWVGSGNPDRTRIVSRDPGGRDPS